jgi:Arc/MetJ family transcription regulator
LFVNDAVETLGTAAELLAALELAVELAVELELDDELPQAATPRLAVTTSVATVDLLFSKCTLTSSSSYMANNTGRARPQAHRPALSQ